MTDERPRIEERVGRALSRGNLRQSEVGPCDLDTVGALGLVGIKHRLASAVYRLKYANDAHAYRDALAGVYGLARTLDARGHWRRKRWRLRLMARHVLDYWLSDGCRTCTGVGYLPIHGSPVLSDRPCLTCHGTRKLVMPWLKRLPRKPERRKDGRARMRRWYEVCRKLNDSMLRHRLLLVALETAERASNDEMYERMKRRA